MAYHAGSRVDSITDLAVLDAGCGIEAGHVAIDDEIAVAAQAAGGVAAITVRI